MRQSDDAIQTGLPGMWLKPIIQHPIHGDDVRRHHRFTIFSVQQLQRHIEAALQ